ncbi:MAG: tetratricopeptide repeat protein [Candidatus Hodarchaeota archaeon]
MVSSDSHNEFQIFKEKLKQISSLVTRGRRDLAEEQLENLSISDQLDKNQKIVLEVDILALRGRIAAQKGKIKQGISILSDALSIAENSFYVSGIADVMYYLGRVQWELGEDLELAHEYFQEALTIRTQIQDKGGIAACLNGLGLVELTSGSLEEALKYFQTYKNMSLELNNQLEQANALNNTAEIFRLRGELEEAKKYYIEALKLYQENQDYDGEALAFLNLGWTTWAQNDLSTAVLYLRKGLEIRKRIKSRWISYFSNLVALAGALTDFGKETQSFTESEKLLEEALNYAQSIKSASSVRICWFFQGYLELAKGNLAQAEDLFLECLAGTKGTNFEYMSKSTLVLAEIALTHFLSSYDQKYLEKFVKYTNEALTLAREHKLLVMLCEIHVLKGLFEASKAKYDEALAYLTQSIILAEEKNLSRQKERARQEYEKILEKRRRLKIKTGTLRDADALVYIQSYLENVTEILKRRKER